MSLESTSRTPRRSRWPVVLCWLAVALDGYDLVVLGAVIPTLAKQSALGFTNESLTLASTLGLAGVGLGAVAVGPLTDRFGRRSTLLTCIALFSVCTLLTAVAPTILWFIVFRVVAGLGLGACLPTALAYMSEHAAQGRSGTAMTRLMTGYHVGAVITAILGLLLITSIGWESMFVVGGLAGLAVLPLMWWKLPESETFLAARASQSAEKVNRPRDVVRGRYLAVSIGLWTASFMGLLLVYGLNTWLPSIMGAAGYSIQGGIALLLTLNVGAVIGLLIAGLISDRKGNKPTVLLWFGVAAVALALLSIKIGNTVIVYAAVLLAGIFVFSAQVLVYAFVSELYPPEIRGTALGLAAGVGRVGAIVGPFLGGALVSLGIAYPWGFYAFALAALLAIAALATVPANRTAAMAPS
ncbi:MFS transporter [Mycolicibacterium chlorophenolicum]|uniref:MFS transporter n=1 Tax=Mycolicibacterium chlorophenolicum TaxID=37916 RepID=UPI0006535C72|nr:aromatic acid/H+ symport family MFS transporter [Mycolicibacterium chlorophenolicum]